VCCYTHAEPALRGGRAAEAEEFRCRCGYGGESRCVRQATGEDLLCDRYRAGLAVADPSALTVVTGTG